jgi:DNA-binding NarL/FixJ family response regulator
VAARILIADDNPTLIANLRATLNEHEGWTVCGEAANGRQAVLMVSQLRPDLVVLDWSMPVLNGLDAATEILKLSPQTPIVMFTLHKDSVIELAVKRLGVKQMVSKSDGASALITAIESVLGRPKERAAAAPTVGPLAVPTDLPPPQAAAMPAASDVPSAAGADGLSATMAASANEAGAVPIGTSAESTVLPATDAPPSGIPPEPGAQ